MAKKINRRIEDKRHISEEIMDLLPGGLANLKRVSNLQKRDIYVLSAIAGMSTCMPNVLSRYYDKSKLSPHIYLYVAGPPESGKSAINIAQQITLEVDELIRNKYVQERKEYNIRKNAARKGEDFDEVEPQPTTLLVADDITASAFVQAIVNQRETGSMLVSSEAGTLATSLSADYGGFAHQLLKCWEHELIIKDLASLDDALRCKFPKLTLVLASNYDDFEQLLTKASSSGLLSRLLMYTTSAVKDKHTCFAAYSDTELYQTLRGDCMQMYKYFVGKRCKFELTDRQKRFWDGMANSLITSIKRLNPYLTQLTRFIISLYRELMVIAVYRAFCEGRTGDVIHACDDDFAIVKELAYLHANRLLCVYDTLPSLKTKSAIDVYAVLKSMPKIFRSSDFKKKLMDGGMKPRTAEDRIKSLKDTCHILTTDKRGQLHKGMGECPVPNPNKPAN